MYIYIHIYCPNLAASSLDDLWRSFTVRCPDVAARASSIGVIIWPAQSFYVNRVKTEDPVVKRLLMKCGINVRPCMSTGCSFTQYLNLSICNDQVNAKLGSSIPWSKMSHDEGAQPLQLEQWRINLRYTYIYIISMDMASEVSDCCLFGWLAKCGHP